MNATYSKSTTCRFATLLLSFFLAFGLIAFTPQEALAKSKYVGTYEKAGKWNSRWNNGQGAPSSIYTIKIKSVSKNKIKFRISCAWAYGSSLGMYQIDTKTVTAKLKGRTAKFSWKSYCGSQGTGVIKLTSKNKVKLKMTTRVLRDRMAPNFGYKTFKRK